MARARRISVYAPQGALGDTLVAALDEAAGSGGQRSGILLRWALLGQQAELAGWSIAIADGMAHVIGTPVDPASRNVGCGRMSVPPREEPATSLHAGSEAPAIQGERISPALPAVPDGVPAFVEAADQAMASLLEQFDC